MVRPVHASAQPGARLCFGDGARLREGGYEIARLRPQLAERDVEPHIHDEPHFVLVLEGTYLSSAAGAPPVGTGPMLIYNPAGTMHRDRFRGDHGRFVAFGLPGEAPDEAGLPEMPVLLGGFALLSAMRAAHAMDDPDPDAEGLCAELVAAAAAPGESGLPAWLIRAREMIDDLAGRGIRIAEVAAEVGVHPVHLARAFRDAWGCAPSDYHSWRRAGIARRLLADRRLSLVEVALRTGFGDQSHLTRTFTCRYGIAPGAYRNALGMLQIDKTGAEQTA